MVYSDDSGRIIVCNIVSKEIHLVVASVYLPAKKNERLEWLLATNDRFANEEVGTAVDIIGGDWNQGILKLDKANGVRCPRAHKDEAQRLIEHLGNNETDYVDGWRERHPETVQYSFFRKVEGRKVGKSRIDRIYVREDWFARTSGWTIEPSGLSTDHHATIMRFGKAESSTDRGPGRWRLQPLLMKIGKVRGVCNEALEALPGIDPIAEWHEYKLQVAETLKQYTKRAYASKGKLAFNLERQKKKLMLKRRVGALNESLEMRVEAVEAQQENLAEWKIKQYTYNAAAKYQLLGEKPTKWFFSKAKTESYNSIKALKDEHEQVRTDPAEMVDIATRFYTKLYDTKPSDPTARERILESLDKRLAPSKAAELEEPICDREIEEAIREAALGKSPGIDGLPIEFYKALMGSKRFNLQDGSHHGGLMES